MRWVRSVWFHSAASAVGELVARSSPTCVHGVPPEGSAQFSYNPHRHTTLRQALSTCASPPIGRTLSNSNEMPVLHISRGAGGSVAGFGAFHGVARVTGGRSALPR